MYDTGLGSQQVAERSFENGTASTGHGDSPEPLVTHFTQAGPKAILGLLVFLEFLVLHGVFFGVALFLIFFVFLVPTNVTEENVVRNRTNNCKRVKLSSAVQKERER